jgi:hypothetical protein
LNIRLQGTVGDEPLAAALLIVTGITNYQDQSDSLLEKYNEILTFSGSPSLAAETA